MSQLLKSVPQGGYDHFLVLLGTSSIWFTEKAFFKIIKYFFNILNCAEKYVI